MTGADPGPRGGAGDGHPGSGLRLADVTFTYPDATVPALADVSLECRPGEVVAIVGESGSGKSTLARLAAGLLRPGGGTIDAGGLDTRFAKPQAIASRLGLVFQNPNHQLLAATIRDELALGPRNLGCAPAEVASRVDGVASRLGLEPVLDRHPYRVPIAVRKRVTIAAVLAMLPSILVLDEPATGQGPRETRSIEGLVRGEAARGVAVVVITHDLQFAGAVADRIVVLRAGRVQAEGPARALLADEVGLRLAGLEPPPLVRLWLALGLAEDPGGAPLTIDETEAALARRASGERVR